MSSIQKIFQSGNESRLRDIVNLKNESGQTLLVQTIFIDDGILRLHTLETLLKIGADPWVADVYGRNALMWACLFRQDSEVSALLEKAESCDLLHADIHGNTALHLSVTSGSAASVKNIKTTMLEQGLVIDIENDYGITPGMEAQRLGYDVCYSLLVSDMRPCPPVSRGDADNSDSGLSSSGGSDTYRHCRRQISSGASSIASLPPLVSPEIKKRMDSLDLKACWNSLDDDPSSCIQQLCKVGNKKSTSNQKKTSEKPTFAPVPPSPRQSDGNLPQISFRRQKERNKSQTLSKASKQLTVHQSLNASRLPEISLTDSVICTRR